MTTFFLLNINIYLPDKTKMMPLQRTASVMFSPEFDPDALKKATDENNNGLINFELQNWRIGNNVSIFVQWIPDELTQENASQLFGQFGIIERIDIVNKVVNSEKIGRMMFVHFQRWLDTSNLPDNIVQNYPEPYNLVWNTFNKYGNTKPYTLKCRVNLRPIPSVEYNCSQLTDMFETMKAEMLQFREIVETLREENHQLMVDMEIMKSENEELRRTMSESICAFEQASDPEFMLEQQYRFQS